MSVTLDSQIRFPSGVMISHLGDETVLLNLDTESYFGLDDVGTVMWKSLQEAGGIRGALVTLKNEYDVDDDTLSRDLLEFVETLSTHGLVETVRGETR